MSNLNISNLKYNYDEIGDFFKASKALFSWEFYLDSNHHKIELQHSRVKGKRVIYVDGKEISNSSKYTYSFNFTFPLEKHFLSIIQISPDQYDLRIDNISFMSLSNKEKISGYNPKNHNFNNNNNNSNQRKIVDDDNFFGGGNNNNMNFDNKVFSNNNDDDFDFGDSKTNKNSNVNIGNQKKSNEQQNQIKSENLIDFGFSDDNNNNQNNNNNNNQNINNNNNQNNNPFDFLNTNDTVSTQNTGNLADAMNFNFVGQSNTNNQNINNLQNNLQNLSNNNMFGIDMTKQNSNIQNNNQNIVNTNNSNNNNKSGNNADFDFKF
jgi:hypothetical protein